MNSSNMLDAKEKKILSEIRTLIDGDRITAFSDSVFAFAATLLVLKIELPKVPASLLETNFTQELMRIAPAYGANFISFLIIAYYWRVHHTLFILIKKYDNILIWLNMLTLIFVSFLPFPIDLFGEYPSVVPVMIFYAGSITVVGVLLVIMWIYSSHRHRLIDSGLSKEAIRYYTLNLAIAPFVFLCSIPLSYYSHVVGKISWVFVIVLLVILNVLYQYKHTRKIQVNL
jgi:uncharacterized membrane protein